MSRIVALVVVDTETDMIETLTSAQTIRASVIAALPKLSSVLAIMSETEATFMLGAHLDAMQIAGMTPTCRSGERVH